MASIASVTSIAAVRRLAPSRISYPSISCGRVGAIPCTIMGVRHATLTPAPSSSSWGCKRRMSSVTIPKTDAPDSTRPTTSTSSASPIAAAAASAAAGSNQASIMFSELTPEQLSKITKIVVFMHKYGRMSETERANVRERLKLSEETISQYGFLTKQYYMSGRTLPASATTISPSPAPSASDTPASPLQSTVDASNEMGHDQAALLPLNIVSLLSVDTTQYTARRVLLSPNPHYTSSSPLMASYQTQLEAMMANQPTLGCKPGDVQDYKDVYTAARGCALVEWFKLCEAIKHSKQPPSAQFSDVVCAFASYVSERLWALVAFARQDVLIDRQLSLDESVSGAPQDAALKRLTASYLRKPSDGKSAPPLPTLRDVFLASGITPREMGGPAPIQIRKYPTSHVYTTFLQHEKFDAMNDFDSLIPTWNEMEAVLLSYPLQPTKWRQWLGTVGSGQLIYQIFTREHMTRVADYIGQQLSTWQRGVMNKPVVILEVNAQNERFSILLKHALATAGLPNDAVKIIAVTDSDEAAMVSGGELARMEYEQAIIDHQPTVVICNWALPRVDITATIRRHPCVYEYILMGEADSDVCGDQWATWGALPWLPSSTRRAPYDIDGFERVDLGDINRAMICKNDSATLNGLSTTVSFRRRTSS